MKRGRRMSGVSFFSRDANVVAGEIGGHDAESSQPIDGSRGVATEWGAALLGNAKAPDIARIDSTLLQNGGTPSQDWALLLGEDPSSKPSADVLDLNRPAAAAKYLVDNWESLGLPDGLNHDDLVDPADSLPKPAQEVLRYIGQNPSVFSALDSGGGQAGMNDGDIWRFDAADFAEKSQEDLSQATTAYGRYLRNNPVASVEERQTAHDVALLAANRGLLMASGSTQFGADNQRPMSGQFDADSLKGLRSNPGLSERLTSAAARLEARGPSRLLGRGEGAPVDSRRLIQWLETN